MERRSYALELLAKDRLDRAGVDAGRTERYPVVVAAAAADAPERDEDGLAYGSLAPYQAKPAFARTVEDSVYVERNRRGAGLGGLILAELIRRARVLEHHSILARI